jgi:hypothetical protein
MHVTKLLHWMELFFQENAPENEPDIRKAYRQELYNNIYKTIESDFKQYQQWRRYNDSLWIIKTYRQKNTNTLAQKILGDMVLFHEGLNMFSKC